MIIVKIITQEELNEIIKLHGKWLNNEKDGIQADFSNMDLTGLSFPDGVDLRGAIFQDAALSTDQDLERKYQQPIFDFYTRRKLDKN